MKNNETVETLRAEFNKTGAMTCPQCRQYNAILVDHVSADGSHIWYCRNSGCTFRTYETAEQFDAYTQATPAETPAESMPKPATIVCFEATIEFRDDHSRARQYFTAAADARAWYEKEIVGREYSKAEIKSIAVPITAETIASLLNQNRFSGYGNRFKMAIVESRTPPAAAGDSFSETQRDYFRRKFSGEGEALNEDEARLRNRREVYETKKELKIATLLLIDLLDGDEISVDGGDLWGALADEIDDADEVRDAAIEQAIKAGEIFKSGDGYTLRQSIVRDLFNV